MAQSKTLFEQRKASSLPTYLLLRIFFAACIGLDALTYDMAQMGGGVQFAAPWDRFNGDGVVVSYVVIYAICHLLCAVLVEIALGRARIIPIWAATALVISSPLLIIGFPIHLTFYHSALLFGSLALLKRTGEGGSARADEE